MIENIAWLLGWSCFYSALAVLGVAIASSMIFAAYFREKRRFLNQMGDKDGKPEAERETKEEGRLSQRGCAKNGIYVHPQSLSNPKGNGAI